MAPFSTEHGGAVVNAAIALRAYAEVAPGGDGYHLHSEDYDARCDAASPSDLPADGRLDLLRVGVRAIDPGPCAVRTWSDAPTGSGLGSSGSLGVALAAALHAARGNVPGAVELAEEAFHLEAEEALHPGGRQDQYAAALGGWHHFSFASEGVTSRTLAVDREFAAELGRRLLLCHTGTSRVSGTTIARVQDAWRRRDPQVTRALFRMVELADEMAAAIESGDIARVGALLSANWREQQRLDPLMCTETMAALEREMVAAGALGGKAAGAGAGGSMFFVMGDDVTRGVAIAASLGLQVIPVQWSPTGIECQPSESPC